MRNDDFITSKYLIIYDANCGTCDAFLSWISDRDKSNIFYFISNTNEKILKLQLDLNAIHLLTPDGLIYSRFTAIFCILKILDWNKNTIKIFQAFVSPVIFDFFYNHFARHRRKYFKSKFCRIDREFREKFLHM